MTQFHGPFDPEISPDGSKIAFEYFNDTYDAAPGCNELTVPPCYAYTQSQGVGITNVDRLHRRRRLRAHDGLGRPALDVQRHAAALVARARTSTTTRSSRRVGATTNDPWFYDPNQGLGVEDVELSRDLQTVVGIAGFSSEKLRVYRTTMSPFGAPDWDHTPFTNKVNVPVAQQCYELPGKFENTTLAPSGKAMAYSTAEGVFVAAIPDNCAPGGAGRARLPGRQASRLGRRRRPARVRVRADARRPTPAPAPARPGAARRSSSSPSRRSGKVTVTVPGRRQGHGDRQAQGPHRRQAEQDGQGRRAR